MAQRRARAHPPRATKTQDQRATREAREAHGRVSEREQRREAARQRHRYPPIESYGIIGDLQTVALVGLNGSIDFLCLPRFDSPSVFARLLDAEEGGRFEIVPRLRSARRRQLYLPDTNVLLTRFMAEEGVVEVSDFMPVYR